MDYCLSIIKNHSKRPHNNWLEFTPVLVNTSQADHKNGEINKMTYEDLLRQIKSSNSQLIEEMCSEIEKKLELNTRRILSEFRGTNKDQHESMNGNSVDLREDSEGVFMGKRDDSFDYKAERSRS